jgi:aryl-alcohol dehydrogenase-like predicted oxidoreductase
VVDALVEIAAELGRSPSQVAIRWLLQRPTVAVVVMGARNEAQLKDNLGAVEFALSEEQMARLDESSARPPTYPYWHQVTTFEERNPPPVPMLLAPRRGK